MSPTDVHSDDTPRADDAAGDDGSAIDRALAALRAGEPVCVHDFDDREGETDLIYPAVAVDADAVARLRNDAGGLVCVALADAVAAAADLPLLADVIEHPAVETTDLAYGDRSSFSLTVNHRDTFTGVTDVDRALTISELGAFADAVDRGEHSDADRDGEHADADRDGERESATAAFAEAFRVPGHVHLLRAAPGGLEERQGHTELGLALARAAGVAPAAVVCEMLDDASGDALPVEAAREYASRHGVPLLEGERIVEALS